MVMKNPQKFFASIIGILAIVFIGGWLFLESTNLTSAPSVDDIKNNVNPETTTSTTIFVDYGLTFNYPKENFLLKDEKKSDNDYTVKINNENIVSLVGFPLPQPYEFGPAIYFRISKTSDKDLKEYILSLESGAIKTSQKNILINGSSWLMIETHFEGAVLDDTTTYHYLLDKNGYRYYIFYSPNFGSQENMSTFENIIKSLEVNNF